ncbi:MAG: tyrosine--tRNA ligase [Chlamydiales bacterium]|nr:tyrosine--tRNA ligase [Chlamydiales bacterium]
MKNLIYTLQERGFIEAMTSDELFELANKPLTVYAGFDPTMDSLHLGNLVGIMGLAWFQRFGHRPIALVGGATGMIGDPSGRSGERNLLDEESIETNLLGIRRSLEAVLKTDVTIVNNYSWFAQIGYIPFLRDIGKHFRLGTMLAKESVKTRLASEEGISYTEFSYQMLQAYDFLHLFKEHQVALQIGGSDQWGNITAGTELVRKITGETVYGMTFPLLTRSDGKKFGKSEGGAIWLNPDRLSVYDFYQYLIRIPDVDLPKMLRMLTFLEIEEIREIEASMEAKDYVPNTAQKRLAEEVTRIVHGQEGVDEAVRVTEAAKPGSQTELDSGTLRVLAADLPSKTLPVSEVVGIKLVDLIVDCGLLGSKGEARRMITGGGTYINNEKVTDDQLILSENHLVEKQFLLLGIGKKKKLVVRIR